MFQGTIMNILETKEKRKPQERNRRFKEKSNGNVRTEKYNN
jgi:hypothetical protein